MPAVTLSTTVDLSLIKMKWKEPYVSEGLNHKAIPSSPKGIYSGLQLIQNITATRRVDIQVGADTAHAAVHLSADGFALTYYDVAGTTMTLDLSSASLDNQETVIALAITYIVGANTTANWIAYPIADWNALSSAQQAELLVVGTINVPAPATNITTAMILQRRRNVAWDGQLPGAVPWSPLLKNPGFEHAITSATNIYSISDWSNTQSAAVNGNFRAGTTAVRTGAKSLEYNKTSTSASTGQILQLQEVPVTPGQNVRITGWIKQLIAPTGGSYQIFLYWGTLDSVASGFTSITVSAAGTDVSFRRFDDIVQVPASKFILKSISIEVVGITSASTGVAVAFDDVQVYLETASPLVRPGALANHLRQQLAAAIIFEDPNSYSLGQLAAMLRFDRTTPTNEGTVVLERRDQTYDSTHLPPVIALLGRILQLGQKTLSTSANALLPRLSVPVSTTGGATFTLMWESPRDGESAGSYTNPILRMYIVPQGGLYITSNALWGGSTWSKDINGQAASRLVIANTSVTYDTHAPGNNTAWADNAWNFSPFFLGQGTAGLIETFGSTIIQGDNSAQGLVVSTLKSQTGHTNLLMDIQSYDGRGTVAIDNLGRLYRRGAYFFEDFDGLALDTNRWTLSNAGTGTTQTSNPGTHTYQMTTGTAAGNFYQITNQMYFYRKNFPRMRARIFTSNLNHSNTLGQAQRIFVGWTSLYLDYDQNTHANLTHWYLQADGTFYDTGIVSNQDGGAGISAGAILSLAQIATNQVLVTVHDQNDTFSSASQVVITVSGSLSTSGRPLVAGVVNTHGIASGAPTLAVDFMEGSECSRLD